MNNLIALIDRGVEINIRTGDRGETLLTAILDRGEEPSIRAVRSIPAGNYLEGAISAQCVDIGLTLDRLSEQ